MVFKLTKKCISYTNYIYKKLQKKCYRGMPTYQPNYLSSSYFSSTSIKSIYF